MAAKESLPSLPPGDGGTAPRKRSRIKMYVILGSILLVLGTAGGATYWLFFKQANFSDIMSMLSSSSGESASTADTKATADKASPASSEQSASADKNKETASSATASGSKGVPRPVPLPELTVNLADPSGTRYLKIGMEVELTNPDVAQELQSQNARVRDAIILLLSSKTVAQLATPEGKVLLKNEVAARLNQILGAPRIVRIFFTNFVFQ